MLIVALISWIVFTLPIGFLRPPVVSCKTYNGTTYLLELPKKDYSRDKRSVVPPPPQMLTPDTVDQLPLALPLSLPKRG